MCIRQRREKIEQNTMNKASNVGHGPPSAETSKLGEAKTTMDNVWSRKNGKTFARVVNGKLQGR